MASALFAAACRRVGELLRTLPGGEKREIVDKLLDFALAAADPWDRRLGRRGSFAWWCRNGAVRCGITWAAGSRVAGSVSDIALNFVRREQDISPWSNL